MVAVVTSHIRINVESSVASGVWALESYRQMLIANILY